MTMQLFDGLEEVPADFGPSAVTVGKFDGVHAGHRAIIAQLKAAADRRGLAATVVTFDRNPLRVLAPEKCPDALVSNAQKAELLEAAGIDATLVLPFDRAFSLQAPEDFVTKILVGALHASVVVVGADFRFGVKGSGDLALLRSLGETHGFEVELIGEVTLHGTRRASSTWIRELLDAGNITAATELLGRLPSIRSTVAHGEQRGRELGYPTANLEPVELEGLIPADGVYAAWATVDGERYGAATSIGNNPTFEGVPQKQVEAHLLDQQLDLYGRELTLEFVEYVRPMNKFESMDALAAQMHLDENRIRTILEYPPR
jgi:riboflavin kinase/FMN adenylyltransferase